MYKRSFSPRLTQQRHTSGNHRRPQSTRPPRRSGTYINPDKFISKGTAPLEQVIFNPEHQFADFGLNEALRRNVVAKGYDQPTPIQDQAIPVVLAGNDLVGLANTGTGKTAAFAIPIIERLLTVDRGATALIVAPTRELAAQIHAEFAAFAGGLGLLGALCVGGTNLQRQITALARRPQVVIGTPGRLKDLYNQGKLNLGGTKILVLDEADQMLDMGFIRDIRYLIDKLPKQRQTLCFSATMSREIQILVSEFLTNPVDISVRVGETGEHIDQDVINVTSGDQRFAILDQMLRQPEFEKVLIFGQTKHGVQRLADNLAKAGIAAEAIHGNKSQPQRQRALQAFKDNKSQVLVATDVAARGLDIPNVSHVINYDLPQSYDNYIHRIGRTGRAGKTGQALTFVVSSHPPVAAVR